MDDLRFAGRTHEPVNITVPVYSHPVPTSVSIIREDNVTMGADNLSTLLNQDTTVETMFYGVPVSLDGQHVTLTIHNLKEQDFTGYTLIITNDFGTIEKQMTLNGESKYTLLILANRTSAFTCEDVSRVCVF